MSIDWNNLIISTALNVTILRIDYSTIYLWEMKLAVQKATIENEEDEDDEEEASFTGKSSRRKEFS